VQQSGQIILTDLSDLDRTGYIYVAIVPGQKALLPPHPSFVQSSAYAIATNMRLQIIHKP
jgi:hypothetical protein